MNVYVVSLGAGLLVGLIYSLLNVRSPAPPSVALVGLFGILVGEQLLPVGKQLLVDFGILVGEQLLPVGKQLLVDSSIAAAWREGGCSAHMFGMLPGRHGDADTAEPKENLS